MMETAGFPAGRSGSDWSPEEVAAVVADHFAMFADEIAGRPYNKAERNRALQATTGRSKGSIEFKHQNISAVLAELGLPWLRGYKPRSNYQDALIAEVGRHLATMPGLDGAPANPPQITDVVADLFVQPPALRGQPQSAVMERLVRKFDPAERDERNRALGRAGEAFVVEVEERLLHAAGRTDLMRDVRWVSRDDGAGAGFDIRSFDPGTGRERLIEVKTTRGAKTTPFFLTRREKVVSSKRAGAWRLYRVFEFDAKPRIFTLEPPLEGSVNLTPATWSVSFTSVA